MVVATDFSKLQTSYEALRVASLADGQELVVPVHRLAGSGDGPTLGLVALLHGDETLPNEIVRRVLQAVDPTGLRGSILAAPLGHAPALEALTRNSPIDMLDLNRSFPGARDGWVTERLAYVLAHEFLDRVDLLIDMHSGGVFPTVDYVYTTPEARTLALALGCELMYVARDPHPGGLLGVARARGIPATILEIGGGLVGDEYFIGKGVRAVLNVLKRFGMIDGEPELPEQQILFDEMAWLRPAAGGILYPEVALDRLGGVVVRGELLGRVVSAATYEVLEELRAPFERGYLVLLRASLSRVNPGDFAYMVGNADSTVDLTG
jgi:predicted deacylase